MSAATPLERLAALGLELPSPVPALASYVPTRLVPIGDGRSLLYIAGQVPWREGAIVAGVVPDEIGVEEAREAARLCALNVLAHIEHAAGLARVEQIAQLTGWVRCSPAFEGQPRVVDAASDLLVEVLGDAGRHTRAAVGASALPRGAVVEIAAVVVVGP